MMKKDDIVCWCFGYAKQDIENDYKTNGKSTILEKIIAAKKAGKCNCAENNPKGK